MHWARDPGSLDGLEHFGECSDRFRQLSRTRVCEQARRGEDETRSDEIPVGTRAPSDAPLGARKDRHEGEQSGPSNEGIDEKGDRRTHAGDRARVPRGDFGNEEAPALGVGSG